MQNAMVGVPGSIRIATGGGPVGSPGPGVQGAPPRASACVEEAPVQQSRSSAAAAVIDQTLSGCGERSEPSGASGASHQAQLAGWFCASDNGRVTDSRTFLVTGGNTGIG